MADNTKVNKLKPAKLSGAGEALNPVGYNTQGSGGENIGNLVDIRADGMAKGFVCSLVFGPPKSKRKGRW